MTAVATVGVVARGRRWNRRHRRGRTSWRRSSSGMARRDVVAGAWRQSPEPRRPRRGRRRPRRPGPGCTSTAVLDAWCRPTPRACAGLWDWAGGIDRSCRRGRPEPRTARCGSPGGYWSEATGTSRSPGAAGVVWPTAPAQAAVLAPHGARRILRTMTNWVSVSSFATAGWHARAGAGHLRLGPVRQPGGPHRRTIAAGEPPSRARAVAAAGPRREDDVGRRHWAAVAGGRAAVEIADGNIYLAMSLRNVGSGIAVLHGWWPSGERRLAGTRPRRSRGLPDADARPVHSPRATSASGRAPSETRGRPRPTRALPMPSPLPRPISIELLYGDHEGGQRAISRFHLVPRPRRRETRLVVHGRAALEPRPARPPLSTRGRPRLTS